MLRAFARQGSLGVRCDNAKPYYKSVSVLTGAHVVCDGMVCISRAQRDLARSTSAL
jgi:hypothetical protein